MKRIFTLLAATLCAATSVRSQTYFQHLYGTKPTVEFAQGSCLSSFNGSQSHCITGRFVDTKVIPSISCVAVTRPDLNGQTINADNFQKYYTIQDNQGNDCNAEGIAITEFDDNGKPGFGITGVFSSPNGTGGMFIMAVDEFGSTIIFKAFEFLNVSGERPSAIAYGPNGKDFVVTGLLPAQFPTDPTDIFVTSLDAFTGNPGATYVLDVMPNPLCMKQQSNDQAFDILTDPYTIGRDQYYIVGRCNDQYGQVMGFLLGIDDTINPNMLQLYTTGNVDQQVEFYSISESPRNSGYIIGGRYGEKGIDDNALVLLTDGGGKVVWNTIFDYAPKRGTDNVCRDVKAFKDEFYAVGVTVDGVFGKKDIHGLHLDSKGNGLPNGDFTYGSKDDDFPTGVETEHGLFFMGGTNMNAAPDFYMIHPDLNGGSTCKTFITHPLYAAPKIGQYHSNWRMIPFVINVDFPPFSITEGLFDDATLCSDVKPEAKKAAPEKASVLYPNPATDRFTVRLNGNMVSVKVSDISGRTVYQNEVAGTSVLEIDAAQWNAGTYLVQLCEAGGDRQVLRLVVSHQ